VTGVSQSLLMNGNTYNGQSETCFKIPQGTATSYYLLVLTSPQMIDLPRVLLMAIQNIYILLTYSHLNK